MSQDELERRKLFTEILEYEQDCVSARKTKISQFRGSFQNDHHQHAEHGSHILISSN